MFILRAVTDTPRDWESLHNLPASGSSAATAAGL
jgi:hypothetical protein